MSRQSPTARVHFGCGGAPSGWGSLTRISHALEAGAPACCRLTRFEGPKPATCRRSGPSPFRAGHKASGPRSVAPLPVQFHLREFLAQGHGVPDMKGAIAECAEQVAVRAE